MSALSTILSPAQQETAIQLLDDGQAAKLQLLAGEITDILAASATAPLQSELEAHALNNLLGRAAKAGKELDALRRERVDPLNAEVKHVNNLFRPMGDMLDRLTTRGKELLAGWQRQERARLAREQEEARKRADEVAAREAEALAAGDQASVEEAQREQVALELAAPREVPKGYKSDEATSTVRERWVFEVVDAALVPRSFCVPDERAIRAAIAGGTRQIPGVNIYQEDQVVIRSR